MTRLTIDLQEDERQALWALAKKQRRHSRAQAAILVRTKLLELGLLQEQAASDEESEVIEGGKVHERQKQ